MFNHLLPLDHDRQTCLSDSSGLRRLNRGSCHTQKFALLYSSSMAIGSKDHSSHFLLIEGLKARVCTLSKDFEFLRPQMDLKMSHMSQGTSMSKIKLLFRGLLTQWLR